MNNDTVSRQLVIDTLIPLPGIGRKAIDKIRDLPPAEQPEITDPSSWYRKEGNRQDQRSSTCRTAGDHQVHGVHTL